jgi:hypothetical protein
MNKKFGLFLLIILLLGIVIAQDLGSIGDSIEDKIGNVEGNITKIRDFTEQDKTDFLAKSWEKLVLKNKYISFVNGFFEKIDFVFVFFFAKHWEFSIKMLFVFMLWLFTLLSIRQYLYFENNGLNWFVSLGGAVVLAHIQLFNYAANGLFKIFAYKNNLPWGIASFALILVLIVFYFKLNNIVSKIVKKNREKSKEKEKKHKEKVRDTYDKSLKEAEDSVEGA